jgi:hypothetical protein
MSNKYCIVYYCYGDASPRDINHNPIPSICSIRQYNSIVPITVMHAEDNADFFEPYDKILNFTLHKFTARSNSLIHQLVYRPFDTYDYLLSTDYDYVIYCDTDVIWHKNPDDFFYFCLQSAKKLWFCENFNTGLHAIGKYVDVDFMKVWHAIGHLLHIYNDTHVVQSLITKANHTFIHDESALAVLRELLKKEIKGMYCYPVSECYTPIKNGKYITPGVSAVHYIGGPFITFLVDTFSPRIIDTVGEIGALLSVKEYRATMKQCLATQYHKFIKNFLCLPELYNVEEFINQWREYVQLH